MSFSRVLIIETSDSKRGILREVLKSFDCKQVLFAASIKEAQGFIDNAECPQWILASLLTDQNINALQLLKIIASHDKYRGIRMSLLIDENERKYLPKAFELGLLSFHPNNFSKTSLTEQIQMLMSLLRKYKFNSALTAAYYLRGIMRDNNSFEECLGFEERLLDAFPDAAELMISLAEAQQKALC